MSAENFLTGAQEERLIKLIEEANEVSKVACKILCHGYRACDPTVKDPLNNQSELEKEIGHLQLRIGGLMVEGDIREDKVKYHYAAKLSQGNRWMHYYHPHLARESNQKAPGLRLANSDSVDKSQDLASEPPPQIDP